MYAEPSTQLSAPNGTDMEIKSGRAWRFAASAAGLFVLLFGAADIASRLSHAVLGENASLYAFAPLVLVQQRGANVPNSIATSTGSTTIPLVPARIKIPSIGVNAEIEPVGKKNDGTMGSPQEFDTVGWYALGPKPGEPGSAVMDGHVNNGLTTSGVFAHLPQIALGDSIIVQDTTGKSLEYVVVGVKLYDANASTEEVFTSTGLSRLVLYTCDGEWIKDARSFDKRFVVFATLK